MKQLVNERNMLIAVLVAIVAAFFLLSACSRTTIDLIGPDLSNSGDNTQTSTNTNEQPTPTPTPPPEEEEPPPELTPRD